MRRLIIIETSNIDTARITSKASFAAEYNIDGDDSDTTHYASEVDEELGNKMISRLTNGNVSYFSIELSTDQKLEDKMAFLDGLGIKPRTRE